MASPTTSEGRTRRSLYEHLRALFLSPPAGTFGTAFNVYNVADLQNKSFVPVRPYLYMSDMDIKPTETRLPLVMVGIESSSQEPYEVGNRAGHLGAGVISIFADGRDMRDALAGVIQDYIGESFTVYDYGTAGSPAYDTAYIFPGVGNTRINLAEDAASEATLLNFRLVTFDFQTLK